MRYSMVWWGVATSLVLLASSVIAENITSGYPPVILKGPPPHLAYNVGRSIDLVCEATGTPSIFYEWYKDGVLLRRGENGTFLLKLAESSEGIYQCQAYNFYGRAMSNNFWLQRAYLEKLTGRSAPQREHVVDVKEGGQLFLPCNHSISVPASNTVIKWKRYRPHVIPKYLSSIHLDNRVAQTSDGTLVIAYVIPEDGDWVYTCQMDNSVVGKMFIGNDYKVAVEPNPRAGGSIPTRVFTSPGIITVLQGQNVSIYCIFSAKPDPPLLISWQRTDGLSLPKDRLLATTPQYELKIVNVQPGDEGRYECQANNSFLSQTQLFDVIVHTKPEMVVHPSNVAAVEGEDAEYMCEATSTPAPSYKWFINQVPVADAGRSWHVEAGGQLLVLPSVSVSDSFTVHCNASNPHGYVLAGASLSVSARPPTTSSIHTTTVETTTAPTTSVTTDITPDITTDSHSNASATVAGAGSKVTKTPLDANKDTHLSDKNKDVKYENNVVLNEIGKSDKREGTDDDSRKSSGILSIAGGSISSTAIVLIIVIIVITACIVSLVVLYVKRRTCKYEVQQAGETEQGETEKFNKTGDPHTIQVIDPSEETTQLRVREPLTTSV